MKQLQKKSLFYTLTNMNDFSKEFCQTLKNKQFKNLGIVFLTVLLLFINKQVFSQEFPSSFSWITDTVYISGAASDGGNGSKNSPYNSWDNFSFKSKTAYLFKRGESMDVDDVVSIKADSIFFGGYGSGNRPLFNGNGTNKHFYFTGTQQYIQGIDVQCQDTGTCFTFYGDSTKFLWADSIGMSHSWWGTNPGGYGKIILSNMEIHRIRVDGIYSSGNDTIIIKNTSIYDVNRWYDWKQDISSSGGDCIQGENNEYVVIDGCTLDHSDVPGKFALIQNGADTVIVKNSVLTGYDESSVVYAGSSDRGMHFENCKFIGSKKGIWNFGKLVVENCVFKSNWVNCIRGGNAIVCNSTFVDNPGGRVSDENGNVSQGIALSFTGEEGAVYGKIYNCIFYNVRQAVMALETNITASNNNFYNDTSLFDKHPYSQYGDNVFNINPGFDSTRGDTTDFYLLADSKLIDAGIDPSTVGIELLTDINGKERPHGNGYDIGAYEYYDVDDTAISENQSENKVLIYPNPSEREINIEYEGYAIVTVYNSLGQFIQEKEMTNSMQLSINKKGLYFVTLKSDNYTQTTKILIR